MPTFLVAYPLIETILNYAVPSSNSSLEVFSSHTRVQPHAHNNGVLAEKEGQLRLPRKRDTGSGMEEQERGEKKILDLKSARTLLPTEFTIVHAKA